MVMVMAMVMAMVMVMVMVMVNNVLRLEGWIGEGLPQGWIGKRTNLKRDSSLSLSISISGKCDAGNKYGFINEEGSTFVGKNRAIAYVIQRGGSR